MVKEIVWTTRLARYITLRGLTLGWWRVAVILYILPPGVTRPYPLLRTHEWVHVYQLRARFWQPLRYLWEFVKHGYRNNVYEVMARDFAAEYPTAGPDIVRILEGRINLERVNAILRETYRPTDDELAPFEAPRGRK